jgi:HD-like signal output (HDOD) protein
LAIDRPEHCFATSKLRHTVVGGVLARRWGLPKAVASVIEHSDACPTRRPAVQRQIDPCPLSGRDVEVLKRLAE